MRVLEARRQQQLRQGAGSAAAAATTQHSATLRRCRAQLATGGVLRRVPLPAQDTARPLPWPMPRLRGSSGTAPAFLYGIVRCPPAVAAQGQRQAPPRARRR
jgi:hypothetical protein